MAIDALIVGTPPGRLAAADEPVSRLSSNDPLHRSPQELR